jgi:hypothetical protein
VLTDDDEEDNLFDECMLLEGGGKKNRNKNSAYKAYTLCMICNPSACGYDQQFNAWK